VALGGGALFLLSEAPLYTNSQDFLPQVNWLILGSRLPERVLPERVRGRYHVGAAAGRARLAHLSLRPPLSLSLTHSFLRLLSVTLSLSRFLLLSLSSSARARLGGKELQG